MNISGIRPRPGFYESWPGYFNEENEEKENVIYMADKQYQKKDFDPKEAAENRKKELDEMTAKLEQGVQDVFASDDYKKLLGVMAQMPHYSVNNQILIMLQNPEATLCNSFSGWKKQNRYVKAGEKGLRILAPAPYQMEKEQEKTDQNGNILRDKDGEPIKETVKITVNAFKPVSTFDISQTDGEPLPQIGVAELVGNIEGYGTLMEAIKDASPVPIGFENIESGAKGYYHKADHRIAIQEGMSEAQTVKTALHEIAHAKYHSIEATETSGDKKTTAQKECEAESIAFVCSAHYGLNTSDYSFGYVAGWSSGKETPELKASLQTIRQGASEIIDSIDKRIRELTYDRVEANRAPDDFVQMMAEMETPFDSPFAKAEADHPAGFIKIEPPVNVEDFKAEQKIELEADKKGIQDKTEDDEKTAKSKTEKSEKKLSVKKNLADKKKEVSKTPKKEKTSDKKMQEAI